ncbi:MAG: cation:proton antiporter [Chloroflexi bacterium]|nr:cation:proton antiporter [Chloroflexota bacterium]
MTDSIFQEPVGVFWVMMAVVLVTPILSESVRLPGIVGLILGGMLVGPHGFDLIDSGNPVELLAAIGLIYLMFSAGLEVNLAQFNQVRGKSLLFGALTYLIPQILGSAFGYWIGLDLMGAILLGSAFSSHTLIAFPIVTRLGIARNEAVAVTVGATVFTDIAAFIVLALALGTTESGFSSASIPTLLGLLSLYAAAMLFGLPRLGKLFFQRLKGQTVEFQFVLVVLLSAAFLAELIGVHGVVGAFLAGLAINATLPHHSSVINRVLFMGEAFFIPIFLVHSGMITDPLAFISDWDTLLIGLGVSVIAYGSKLLAAWAAARAFHYSRDEMMTIWGLSQAQAAVTIPTLVLGLQSGLFSPTLFNAAILMILLTSITSPVLVQRYGQRLHPGVDREFKNEIFQRILVPVANPERQENLVTLAGILARTMNGVLIACHVAHELHGKPIDLEHQTKLLESPALDDPETKVERLKRIDSDISRGILRASLESDASMIVLGWQGEKRLRNTVFGTLVDEVVAKADIPVLVAKLVGPVNAIRDIAMLIPPDNVSGNAARHALKIVFEIGEALNIPIKIRVAPRFESMLMHQLTTIKTEQPYEVTTMEGDVVVQAKRDSDADTLILIPTTGGSRRFRSSLGRTPHRLSAECPGSLLVISTRDRVS